MAVNALQPGKKLHFVGTNSIVTSTTVETMHQYLAESPTDANYPNLYSNDLAVARVSWAVTAAENISIARLLDLPTRTYGHSHHCWSRAATRTLQARGWHFPTRFRPNFH